MPLAEIAEEVRYGYTASASVESVGPKFLRITDIVPDLIHWGSVPYCTISAKDRNKYLLRDGDIVIARTGATVGYAKSLRHPPESVFASYLVRVRVAEENDARYVGLVVMSHDYKQFVVANAGGAAQPNANAKVLASYPVPLPPLKTQQKIASVVSAYDALIENNTRRIQILEELAQAIYREWFVEFRYPEHEDVALVDSGLSPIPEEWQIANTADLIADGMLEIGDGYRAKNSELGATGLPFLRAKNLRDDFDFRDVDFMPFEALHRVGRKRSQLGDCVITMKGTVGRVGFVSDFTPEFVYSPQLSYWRVLGGDALDRRYLRAWMEGPEFGQQCATVKGSTDMADYVNLKDQRQMRITLPRRDLQERFGEAVSPMFDLVTRLRVARQNLRATRDLLLPRLVSGEIHVSELDIELGDAAA
jgi:type I restriction enzyme, S subunit